MPNGSLSTRSGDAAILVTRYNGAQYTYVGRGRMLGGATRTLVCSTVTWAGTGGVSEAWGVGRGVWKG